MTRGLTRPLMLILLMASASYAALTANLTPRGMGQGPLAMEFTPPLCDRCQLDYAEAPYSCPGDPVSFAPNGHPVFRTVE
jgi:hypothetical protein